MVLLGNMCLVAYGHTPAAISCSKNVFFNLLVILELIISVCGWSEFRSNCMEHSKVYIELIKLDHSHTSTLPVLFITKCQPLQASICIKLFPNQPRVSGFFMWDIFSAVLWVVSDVGLCSGLN